MWGTSPADCSRRNPSDPCHGKRSVRLESKTMSTIYSPSLLVCRHPSIRPCGTQSDLHILHSMSTSQAKSTSPVQSQNPTSGLPSLFQALMTSTPSLIFSSHTILEPSCYSTSNMFTHSWQLPTNMFIQLTCQNQSTSHSDWIDFLCFDTNLTFDRTTLHFPYLARFQIVRPRITAALEIAINQWIGWSHFDKTLGHVINTPLITEGRTWFQPSCPHRMSLKQ